MRGGVANPNNYNIGSPRGPPNGSGDLNQHFGTNPNLHAADHGRPAWQQAPQDARDAHRRGLPPQQQELASVEVGNQQATPGVHYMFYAGVRAFNINRKGIDNLKVFKSDMGSICF